MWKFQCICLLELYINTAYFRCTIKPSMNLLNTKNETDLAHTREKFLLLLARNNGFIACLLPLRILKRIDEKHVLR